MIAALFIRLVEGDAEKALEELHHRYYFPLLGFVDAMINHREAAEEIVNDVFIIIWKRREKLQFVRNPEVYLFVCAKNEALKYLQSRRITFAGLDELPDVAFSLERNPEDILISAETLQHINKAIAALPPRCRMIFRLVKQNNLKYREVAEVLDLSEKTVENQLVIALKKISGSLPVHLLPDRKK